MAIPLDQVDVPDAMRLACAGRVNQGHCWPSFVERKSNNSLNTSRLCFRKEQALLKFLLDVGAAMQMRLCHRRGIMLVPLMSADRKRPDVQAYSVLWPA